MGLASSSANEDLLLQGAVPSKVFSSGHLAPSTRGRPPQCSLPPVTSLNPIKSSLAVFTEVNVSKLLCMWLLIGQKSQRPKECVPCVFLDLGGCLLSQALFWGWGGCPSDGDSWAVRLSLSCFSIQVILRLQVIPGGGTEEPGSPHEAPVSWSQCGPLMW